MGRNKKSINYQLHERMESMTRFGESKKQAKKEYREEQLRKGENWNPAKAEGIFSFSTYKAYQQTSKEFSNWMKQTHPEIKKIENITRDVIGEYLQQRAVNKSPYTVSKDLSALNKILDYDIKKTDYGLPERSYKAVSRSREERAHDKQINLDNYRDFINIAKGTGCRRESMELFKQSDFIRDSSGLVVEVHLEHEKNGRERYAPVLPAYREAITQYLDSLGDNEKVCEHYPSRIDNHSYRAYYAAERYKELISQLPDDYENNYRGYHLESVLEVSQNMGHNRPSVVVESYSYLFDSYMF